MPDPASVPSDLRPARVFLALWPDDAARRRLEKATRRLHQDMGGRMTRPESTHLTLVFIGDLPRQRVPELVDALRGASGPAFELVLDLADCWRHNRIAYLTASAPPPALIDLVSDLESRLDGLAIPFDHRAYRPHVTLLRKAECKSPTSGRAEYFEFLPIRWPVKEFVLVESARHAGGACYRYLASFPLGGPCPDCYNCTS